MQLKEPVGVTSAQEEMFENTKKGAVLGSDIAWALEYVLADIYYARKYLPDVLDANRFMGLSASPCLAVEGGIGLGATISMGVSGVDSVTTGVLESVDYGVTAACGALSSFFIYARSTATALSAASAAAKGGRAAAQAAATAAQSATRWSLFGNLMGAACNALECGMQAAATNPNASDNVKTANIDVDITCAAAGILVGFATADPVMIVISAVALVLQLVVMQFEMMSQHDNVFNPYVAPYESGSTCVADEVEFISVPLLMFYTELHTNYGKSRYGFYVQPINYSDTSPTFMNNLFPAVQP